VALLSWTDAAGTWLLGNGIPGLGGRFQGWEPLTTDVQETAVGLGTGDLHTFRFRTDHAATFRLEELRGAERAVGADGAWRAEAVLDALDHLRRHLRAGGQINVWPRWSEGDTTTRRVCALLPETTPTWEQTDRGALTYALTLSLRATDGQPLRYPYARPAPTGTAVGMGG
jgi:hypothetical protein